MSGERTAAQPEAVTIEGYHVDELRKYLARTESGYDVDDRMRAALYVCGYLEACLNVRTSP